MSARAAAALFLGAAVFIFFNQCLVLISMEVLSSSSLKSASLRSRNNAVFM